MFIVLFLIFSIFFFFSPSDAFAWGPGAHLEYALYALSKLVSLGAPISILLKKYEEDFLYGNIAADIVLGKKFAGDLYHCHHWHVALPLLDRAETDSQKAFIYGYLTHLSVDTVSHNYFVPFHIIKSYDAYTLRHTYWEMRFDLQMPKIVWNRLESLAQQDYSENDQLLSGSLKKALFSFQTNKKIFDGLMLVQRMKRWQKAAHLLTERSSYSLSEADVQEFKNRCHEVAVDFLQNVEKSQAVQADPTGQLKLLYAKEMAQKLKKYRNRHLLSEESAEELIQKIRQSLREGIYQPVELPDVYDVI